MQAVNPLSSAAELRLDGFSRILFVHGEQAGNNVQANGRKTERGRRSARLFPGAVNSGSVGSLKVGQVSAFLIFRDDVVVEIEEKASHLGRDSIGHRHGNRQPRLHGQASGLGECGR